MIGALNYVEFRVNPEPYVVQGVVRGAPRVIRTPDLRIRSPTLYPSELWAPLLTAHFFFDGGEEGAGRIST